MLDKHIQPHRQEPQIGVPQQESRLDDAATLLLQSVDALGRDMAAQSYEDTQYLTVQTEISSADDTNISRKRTFYSIDQQGREIISTLCDALNVAQISSREEYEAIVAELKMLSSTLKANLAPADAQTHKVQKEWIKRALDGVRLRALSSLKKAEKFRLDTSPDHILAQSIKAQILSSSFLILDGSESSWMRYSEELSHYYAYQKKQNESQLDQSDPNFQEQLKALNTESRRIVSIARNFGFQEHCAAMQKNASIEPQKSDRINFTKLPLSPQMLKTATGLALTAAGVATLAQSLRETVSAQEITAEYTQDTHTAIATREVESTPNHVSYPHIDYSAPGEVHLKLDGKKLTRTTRQGQTVDGVEYMTSGDTELIKVLPTGKSLRIDTREHIPLTIQHSILNGIGEIYHEVVEIVRKDEDGNAKPDDDPQRLLGHHMTITKDSVDEEYVIASAEIVDARTIDHGVDRALTTSEMLSVESIMKLRRQRLESGMLEVHASCYSFETIVDQNGRKTIRTDKYLILGLVRVSPQQKHPVSPRIQMALQDVRQDLQQGISKIKKLLKPVNDARQWAEARAARRLKSV